MKTICFFNSTDFWGGGEKLHLEYAEEFRKKGYSVFLFSKKNSPLFEKAVSLGFDVINITAGKLSFLNPFKILKLQKSFAKMKVDAVIFSVSQDLKLGGIAAKITGVEKIIYLRGLAVNVRNNFLNRFIFKNIITHIVANSEATKNGILLHLGKNIVTEKLKVIYHGIDTDKLQPGKNIKLKLIEEKGHGVILGNAGRLTIQKGQSYLIEVAKKLKSKQINFTLFIAGEGELRFDLEKRIKKYDLKNEVVLCGFVGDMECFMSTIDIFLFSSAWEGFGYALVEAMTNSKPVVAYNISSNPEIVINNETGYLVDYPDVEKFAEKTEMLINNESLRKKFGDAGKEVVLRKFQLKKSADEFESFILK